MNKTIKILKVSFLRGPNLWTYYPIIEAWVDLGSLEEYPSDKLIGFNERLLKDLPELTEHQCGLEIPGGFVQRLKEGTWLGHILEHVALELQSLAGMPLRFGKTRQTDQYGIYKLVFRSDHDLVGRAALNSARDFLIAIIENQNYDLNAAIAQLRTLVTKVQISPSAALLLRACNDRSIPAIRIADSQLIQLGYGINQRRIWASETEINSAIADEITHDKPLSKSLLQACGIQLASSILINSESDARTAACDIGFPVTLGPATSSIHKVANLHPLNTYEEVLSAYEQLKKQGCSSMQLVRFMPGNKYHALMMDGSIIALILNSASNNASFDPLNAVDKIHPSIVSVLISATRMIGLNFAGIHFVVRDITLSAKEEPCVILDIYSNPDLMHYVNANSLQSKQLGQTIIERLFPAEASGRVPVIGISGSKNTTVIAHLVSWTLHCTGKKVGLACRDGLYFNQQRVTAGDSVNWESGQQLLINRFNESVVIEHDTKTILTDGLPYDKCDVGVVTDVSKPEQYSDFYIRSLEQLRNLLCTQVDVILPKGTAVLNAEDHEVVKMASSCDGRVIFYAKNEHIEPIQHHLKHGHCSVLIRDQDIVIVQQEQALRLMSLSKLQPSLLSKVDAVLASVASLWALNTPPELIVTGLSTFKY